MKTACIVGDATTSPGKLNYKYFMDQYKIYENLE